MLYVLLTILGFLLGFGINKRDIYLLSNYKKYLERERDMFKQIASTHEVKFPEQKQEWIEEIKDWKWSGSLDQFHKFISTFEFPDRNIKYSRLRLWIAIQLTYFDSKITSHNLLRNYINEDQVFKIHAIHRSFKEMALLIKDHLNVKTDYQVTIRYTIEYMPEQKELPQYHIVEVYKVPDLTGIDSEALNKYQAETELKQIGVMDV